MTSEWQNCVQEVELDVREMVTYLGLCDATGGSTFEGYRLNVRVIRPQGVIFDGKDFVYIGLYSQMAILKVDTDTGYTKMFASTPEKVRYLAFSQETGKLHAVVDDGFLSFNVFFEPLYDMGGAIQGASTVLGPYGASTELEDGIWILGNPQRNR